MIVSYFIIRNYNYYIHFNEYVIIDIIYLDIGWILV